MPRIFFYLFIAVILISCNNPVRGPNGVIYKSAAQYNDYIVSRQNTLITTMLELDKLSKSDLGAAKSLLSRNAQDADRVIREVKGMPPWKSDSSLRDAAVKLFSFYKKLYSITYPQMIRIRENEATITDEDVAEMVRLSEQVKTEEEGFDKALQAAQEEFAKRNHMKLEENEIQKKVDSVE